MPKGFSKADADIEQFGKAIGSRTRVRILHVLSGGPKSVQEIVEALGRSSQPGVSQHLKTLRNAALVSSERVGQEVHYSFKPKKYFGMLHLLASSIRPREH